MGTVDGYRVWLDRYFPALRSASKDYQYSACCPFCVRTGLTPDTKFHLGINTSPMIRACHCFRCGYSGSLMRLVRDLTGQSYLEVKDDAGRLIRDRWLLLLGGDEMSDSLPLAPDLDIALPEESKPIDSRNPLHSRGYHYLADRGVSDEMIAAYGLRFCVQGEYAQRIIIPVVYEGRTVGFTARTVNGEVPKYKFPPGFKAKHFLYNFDRAVSARTVVLVEGVFDAWRLPSSAVGLFSNHMSEEQKILISRTWKHAIVMLDKGEADNAMKIARALAGIINVSVASLRSSKDPWEASTFEVSQAIKTATQTRSIGLEAYLS